jgi:prepilin-type N-terminal cleavage/methylation domain-containing protein
MKKNGFTLTEISVVLVVIALIVSAVTAATSAITNAKLQTAIKELSTYRSAIFTFKDKFRYYPGDIPNAETYWGESNTDNGNGDWTIHNGANNEPLKAWRHLYLAKLTDMNLTGVDAGTPDFVIGKNIPPSAYSDKSHYHIQYSTNHFSRNGNGIALSTSNSDTQPYGGALPPKHAAKIDKKLDDGIANTGMVYGVNGNSSGVCSAAISHATGLDYDFDTSWDTPCRLIYWFEKK